MVSTGAKIIRMIVKNDAVKSDPPEIYGWRAFAMAGSACFGGMLFGFDIGTIGGVLELKEFRAYVCTLDDHGWTFTLTMTAASTRLRVSAPQDKPI
jgi:hypothetical protein